MKIRRIVFLGIIVGVAMSLALFITGAVAARLVYGSGMVPEGKFTTDQISIGYFLWTKLVIGIFFGVLLSMLYEVLPLKTRISNIRGGLLYSFLLWLIVYLWGLSHPLMYELSWSLNKNQFFWMIYTLGGFLGLGVAFGAFRKIILRGAG